MAVGVDRLDARCINSWLSTRSVGAAGYERRASAE